MITDQASRLAIMAVLRYEGSIQGSRVHAVAADELDRLWDIVDKLPKTADDVSVVPGMVLHVPQMTPLWETRNSGRYAESANEWTVLSVGRKYIKICRESLLAKVRTMDCYSTPEAAEAARKAADSREKRDEEKTHD